MARRGGKQSQFLLQGVRVFVFFFSQSQRSTFEQLEHTHNNNNKKDSTYYVSEYVARCQRSFNPAETRISFFLLLLPTGRRSPLVIFRPFLSGAALTSPRPLGKYMQKTHTHTGKTPLAKFHVVFFFASCDPVNYLGFFPPRQIVINL